MSVIPAIDTVPDSTGESGALSPATSGSRGGDRVRYATANVAVGLAFFLSAKLGHLVAIEPGTITPIWLPSGIALAGVLHFGSRVWPGIWVAAFVAGLPTLFIGSAPVELARSMFVGMTIASGSTLEPILGAYLYTRATGRVGVDPLSSVRHLSSFLLLAGAASCSVNATIGVSTLTAGGLLPLESYTTAWTTWWIGNTIGVVLIAPLLLAWRRRPGWLTSGRAGMKPIALLVLLTAFSVLLFSDWLGRGVAVPLALITVPVLTWTAYSYGRHGATLGAALVAGIALVNTAAGHGPFAGEILNDSLVLLQLCIGMIVVTSLSMSAEVSERRTAEQQSHRLSSVLAHSGRVSLTGEMAAGMAHEFHQPLSVIANYANSCLIRLRRGEALGEEVREPLQNIVNETMRAARVIRGVRGFLQKAERSQVPTDINTLVADSLELALVADVDSGVVVSMDLDSRSPSAWVDPTQITQIFVNLVLNAIDAMRDSSDVDKRIKISTRARIDTVECRVADNGPGIAPDDREQCFERFYSTKEAGLGMGLAICRTLVERHGGKMWIEESPDGGAAFCFTLPVKPLLADGNLPEGKL